MAISALRDALVREAREWINTRYVEHAQVKGAGCDCASFLAGVFGAVGVLDLGGRTLVEVVGHYPVQWNVHGTSELYLQWLATWAEPVDLAALQPGDLAMFRMTRHQRVAHSAILVELRPRAGSPPLYLSEWVHCLQPAGVHAMIWNDQYARRLHGFYRMRGLA